MAAFLQSLRCFFRSDFAFAFYRAHNPCSSSGGFSMEGAPFLLQRRSPPSPYNGDHSSEMAGVPPVGRRARTTRKTPSNYVRATLLFGAHSSSRLLVPPVGRRARTTRTTPSEYVRTTLLFGAHSSSRLLVASVPRQLAL